MSLVFTSFTYSGQGDGISSTTNKYEKIQVFYYQTIHEELLSDRQVAAKNFLNVFLTFQAKELIRLLEDFRKTYTYRSSVWNDKQPEQVFAGIDDEEVFFALLAISTFHPNGFFKSKSMEALTPYKVRALPFYILQLNSWVTPIRNQAYSYVEQLLSEASSQEIYQCLPYWDKVNKGNRKEKSAFAHFQKKFVTALSAPTALTNNGLTLDDLLSSDADVRRIYYHLINADARPTQDWLTLMEREKDPFNKLLICDLLTKAGPPTEEVLSHFLNSSVAKIRVYALRHKCQVLEHIDEIKPYLLDKSRTIRALAQFELQQRGFTNFTQFYMSELENTPTPAAVYGLAETGNKTHVEMLKHFLQHSQRGIVQAAIFGIGLRSGHNDADLYYQYLLGDEISYASAAFKIIKGQYIRYDCAKVFIDFQAAKHWYSRSYLSRIIFMGTVWNQLPFLLYMSKDLDSNIRDTAIQSLNAWLPGAQTPSDAEIERAKEAFNKVKLPTALYKKLRFNVEPYIFLGR